MAEREQAARGRKRHAANERAASCCCEARVDGTSTTTSSTDTAGNVNSISTDEGDDYDSYSVQLPMDRATSAPAAPTSRRAMTMSVDGGAADGAGDDTAVSAGVTPKALPSANPKKDVFLRARRRLFVGMRMVKPYEVQNRMMCNMAAACMRATTKSSMISYGQKSDWYAGWVQDNLSKEEKKTAFLHPDADVHPLAFRGSPGALGDEGDAPSHSSRYVCANKYSRTESFIAFPADYALSRIAVSKDWESAPALGSKEWHFGTFGDPSALDSGYSNTGSEEEDQAGEPSESKIKQQQQQQKAAVDEKAAYAAAVPLRRGVVGDGSFVGASAQGRAQKAEKTVAESEKELQR